MKICKKCQTIYDDGIDFCLSDGAPLRRVKEDEIAQLKGKKVDEIPPSRETETLDKASTLVGHIDEPRKTMEGSKKIEAKIDKGTIDSVQPTISETETAKLPPETADTTISIQPIEDEILSIPDTFRVKKVARARHEKKPSEKEEIPSEAPDKSVEIIEEKTVEVSVPPEERVREEEIPQVVSEEYIEEPVVPKKNKGLFIFFGLVIILCGIILTNIFLGKKSVISKRDEEIRYIPAKPEIIEERLLEEGEVIGPRPQGVSKPPVEVLDREVKKMETTEEKTIQEKKTTKKVVSPGRKVVKRPEGKKRVEPSSSRKGGKKSASQKVDRKEKEKGTLLTIKTETPGALWEKDVKDLIVKVTITSSPPGAQFFVDGEMIGTTPLTVPLDLGIHTVKVMKEGYSSETRTINIERNRPYIINFTLKEVSSTVSAERSILVSSNPVGSSVYLNGVYYGETPLTIKVVPGGYHLRITKPGYPTYEENIYIEETLKPGQREPFFVDLTRLR